MNLNTQKKKQATKEVKLSLREKKHQANLRKNNGLYFQIGLVATLFIVFGVFQLKFTMDPIEIPKAPFDIVEVVPRPFGNFEVEKEIPRETVKQVKQKPTEAFKEVPDETVLPLEILPDIPVVEKQPSLNIEQVPDLEEEQVVTIPVSLVSEYPVYPGCDKFEDKESQVKCFQQKITKHIVRKFNSDIAAENGLTGELKIMVMFTINHEGDIVDVKARAPHPELKKEAIKAVSSLPKMKPAKQGYKKVNVTYALPVVFRVD